MSVTKKFVLTTLSLLLSVVLHAQVLTGIDVLQMNGFEELRGKRVGLVTNPSGVDRNLRSTIDILFEAPEVNLVALYGPEHGVRGDAYAGDHVEGSTDAKTGLPVFSLYGSTREPSPEMLKDIDVMVYDIQDVGVRCYTFISTLGLVMRACGKAGIEVLVLDRPNPLGGNTYSVCVRPHGRGAGRTHQRRRPEQRPERGPGAHPLQAERSSHARLAPLDAVS